MAEYIRREEKDEKVRDLLIQAFELKTLIILIDGIDEAASLTQMIEDFILDTLVPLGLRVVATSRPEGVRLRLYNDFVICNLAPLDDAQQRRAINAQLESNAFYENLRELSKIRKDFDELYANKVCPTQDARKAIEEYKMPMPDAFRNEDGTRNPEARQRKRDPNDSSKMAQPPAFICQSNVDPSAPRSQHLQSCCAFFVPEVLSRITEGLEGIDTTKGTTEAQLITLMAALPHDSVDALRGECQAAGYEINSRTLHDFREKDSVKNLKLGVKLGALVLKWRRLRNDAEQQSKLALFLRAQWSEGHELTAASLWSLIVRRTDEIYVASEDLYKPYCEALGMLTRGLSFELAPGAMKDPIRIHEKALDDYLTDFDDFDDPSRVIPEACVTDVLRCRAIGEDVSTDILALQQRLARPMKFTLADGSEATFTLMRSKNRFERKNLSPTHFRCILNNLQFSWQGRESVVELQLHHRRIIDKSNQVKDHQYYAFFRALLQDRYEKEIDHMLDKTIVTFEQVSQTPVLLAMLVVALRVDGNEVADVPRDSRALYASAMRKSVQQRIGANAAAASVVTGALHKVACRNHSRGMTELTQSSGDSSEVRMFSAVHEVLDEVEYREWQRLAGEVVEGGVPLVKTLEVTDDGAQRPAQLALTNASSKHPQAKCALPRHSQVEGCTNSSISLSRKPSLSRASSRERSQSSGRRTRSPRCASMLPSTRIRYAHQTRACPSHLLNARALTWTFRCVAVCDWRGPSGRRAVVATADVGLLQVVDTSQLEGGPVARSHSTRRTPASHVELGRLSRIVGWRDSGVHGEAV